MANWKYKVNIKDLHQSFQAGSITIHEVAHSVAERLKKLPCYPEDDDLEIVVFQLETFEDEQDVDDYDNILHELYDWGDEEVEPRGKWPPNKQCWIGAI